MAQRRVFTGPTPIPNAAAPGEIFLPWKREELVPVCPGMRLMVDVFNAEFDFTDITGKTVNYNGAGGTTGAPHRCFDGSRTGVTFEGPYLGYTPERNKYENGHARTGGQYEPTDVGVGEFFFDLQCKRPIYFPYAGNLLIYGQYPGTWEFNWITFLDGHVPQESPLDSEVVLSMRVASNGADASRRRCNAIPPGGHSLTYRDSNTAAATFPTIQVMQETTPKAVGNNTTQPTLADFNNQSSQFYGRVGLGNAQAMLVTGAGLASNGMLQWHLALF